jgi:hypothetical protein
MNQPDSAFYYGKIAKVNSDKSSFGDGLHNLGPGEIYIEAVGCMIAH